MSLEGIISRYFNTTVTVQRRANTLTSTGSFTAVWNTIASALPASVQSMSVTELDALSQGKEYTATNKAYTPLNVVTIKNGDRIIDDETGLTHEVVGVLTFKASRSDIAIGHHYKLLLEIPKTAKT